MINKSVTVRRRVGGLYKGSKKTLEVLKEGVVGIGGSRFKDGGFYIGLYSCL